MKEVGGDSSKTTGVETDNATTISVAKETNAFSADANKACSNGGSRKDECGDSEGTGAGGRGASQKRPLCYGNKSGKKLLCLRRIWAHGPPL